MYKSQMCLTEDKILLYLFYISIFNKKRERTPTFPGQYFVHNILLPISQLEIIADFYFYKRLI